MGKVYLNKSENDIVDAVEGLLSLAKRTLTSEGYLIVCDEVREMLDGKRVAQKVVLGLSEEEKKVLGL